MKRICIIFGHYNTKTSFCSAVRDTFIEESKKIGNEIDLNFYRAGSLISPLKPIKSPSNAETKLL